MQSARGRGPRQVASEILKSAFDNGAYVAGGTARMLFNARLKYHDTAEAADHAFDKIVNGRRDVDLFFPDRDKLQTFLQTMHGEAVVTRSITGCAINIDLVEKKNMWQKSLFQAITLDRSFGDIRTVMAMFDIMPSMVAFNRDGFVYPIESQELDKNGVLHAQSIPSPFTIKRIEKYQREYGYKCLDSETSEKYVDRILECLSIAQRTNGIAFEYPLTKFMFTGADAKEKLRRTVRSLHTSMLLKASIAFGNDGYNYAFKELMKRSRVQEELGQNNETGLVAKR
jgi:hypothetical protein